MSAFLVEPQHIAEIVKWAKHDEKAKYAYNCFTKEQIDCEPKNMVRLLAQANIDSLIARYGDTEEDFEGYVQDCLDILPYATDGIGESLLIFLIRAPSFIVPPVGYKLIYSHS